MEWEAVLMARAYGDDLRRRVLGAYASGAGTLEQLAARFDVSFGWVKKIRRSELATGSWAGTPQRRRTSSVDAKLVRELVRQKPDIVLRELEEAMRERGHPVSTTQLWRVLKQLGLRLKKSRSTPPNATRKKTAASGKRSSRPSARSHPKT
jgi:transposase